MNKPQSHPWQSKKKLINCMDDAVARIDIVISDCNNHEKWATEGHDATHNFESMTCLLDEVRDYLVTIG